MILDLRVMDERNKQTQLLRQQETLPECSNAEAQAEVMYGLFISRVLDKLNLDKHHEHDEHHKYKEVQAAVLGQLIDQLAYVGRRKTTVPRITANALKTELITFDTTVTENIEAISETVWKQLIIHTALERIKSLFTRRALIAFDLHSQGRSPEQIAETLSGSGVITANAVIKLINRFKLRLVQEIENLKDDLEP